MQFVPQDQVQGSDESYGIWPAPTLMQGTLVYPLFSRWYIAFEATRKQLLNTLIVGYYREV